MIERYRARRFGRRVRIAGMIRRLEGRMRRHRELLWHPRLEFSAARQIAATHRQVEVLRRRMR
jgi:hypothetical protein